MNLIEFKQKSKENFLSICCTEDINGLKIPNTETLKLIITKLEELDFTSWLFPKNTIQFDKFDCRFQLWAKFEAYTVYYYENILLTYENYERLIDETLNLRYSLEFASQTLVFKETYERTNFLSKFYFDLEYFIQQVNSEINFLTSTGSKKKSHYFKELIAHLDITDSIDVNEIINDINRIYGSTLLENVPERKLEYHLFYEYLTTYRNSFHNNGYSQKTLNKLNFGGIVLELKEKEQVKINHAVVFILFYTNLIIFEKITKKLMNDYPVLWKDKYIEDLNAFLNRNKQ